MTALGARPAVPAAAVRLDAGQYNVLWRHVARCAKPLTLSTLDHGPTWSERDALDGAAWRRLAAAGRLDARGEPDPALADLLSVLARPTTEIDVRAGSVDGVTATLACARGDLGVVAALDGAGGLRLGSAPPGDLPAALLQWVPQAAAMPGVPMTVPTEPLRGSLASADGAAAREMRLRRAGVPRPTVERLAAMWARPPLRRLQFGAARRDPRGRRRRGDEVLEVLDTVTGRVLLRPVGRQLLIRPADPPWLRAELGALLAAVPAA